MSSLGTSRPLGSKQEPFPRLVMGDLKAILKTSAKIAHRQMGKMFWLLNDSHGVLIKSLNGSDKNAAE